NAGKINDQVIVKVLADGLIEVSAIHCVRTVIKHTWIIGYDKTGSGSVSKARGVMPCRAIQGIFHLYLCLALAGEVQVECNGGIRKIDGADVKFRALSANARLPEPPIPRALARKAPGEGLIRSGTADL